MAGDDDLTPTIINGMPAGVKPRPRVDFIPTEFDQAITTKGYRMWWSRAGICPCTNNTQTEQPEIICPLCKGDNYYYFPPDAAIANGATEDSEGNAVTMSPDGSAIGIYVLMTSMTQDTQIFEKFGEWVFGMAKVTTQHPNKLGYRDRLTALDSEMTWAQVIEYDGSEIITVKGERGKSGLRYPIVCLHQLRSISTIYRLGQDFVLTTKGELQWMTGRAPTSGTRLSLHCTVHPVWVVVEHVNSYRDTQLDTDGTIKNQKHTKLPIHSVVKLDFLINP